VDPVTTIEIRSSEGRFMGYSTTEALADAPDLRWVFDDLARALADEQPKGPSEPTQPVPLTPVPPRPEPRPDPGKRKQKG
jgi:hypothetical protein